MLVFKAILFHLIIVASLSLLAVAQRGKGRTRSGTRGGKRCPRDTLKLDPNSQKNYYDHVMGARITKASHFDYEYILGHKVVFICEATGNPRPTITWFKDSLELYAHPYLQLHEWKIGEDVIKSKMEIDPATQMDAGLYECHANNKYSIDCKGFKADFSIGE